MAQPCTVLIAAPDLLPALTERTGAVNDDEVLAFSDADALRALEAIINRRPHTVALERQFAATPRGAALINRIKADPALLGSELRIVSHDSDYTRVLPRPAAPAPAPAPSAAAHGRCRRRPRWPSRPRSIGAAHDGRRVSRLPAT